MTIQNRIQPCIDLIVHEYILLYVDSLQLFNFLYVNVNK